MLNIAVLCAQGLGDALLMMIPTYHFMKRGHKITFYHDQPEMLTHLFPHVTLATYPDISDFERHFAPYDLLLVENDHSARAWILFKLRDLNKLPSITFLLPTRSKHPHEPRDFLFNPHLPVASNLQIACQRLLQLQTATKDNGIVIPQGSLHLYPRRIALHPTSKDPKRNWSQFQFTALADKLKLLGYDPYFILHTQEKKAWEPLLDQGYQLFIFSDLSPLCQFLYESGALIGNDSGLGHLASNLGLPTLTISGNPKRVRLWRPDFALNATVSLPCNLLPNFKGIGWNMRDKYWQHFVRVDRVLKHFNKLMTDYFQQTRCS